MVIIDPFRFQERQKNYLFPNICYWTITCVFFQSKLSRLPAYLTVQFVRFYFKEKDAINAKILKVDFLPFFFYCKIKSKVITLAIYNRCKQQWIYQSSKQIHKTSTKCRKMHSTKSRFLWFYFWLVSSEKPYQRSVNKVL